VHVAKRVTVLAGVSAMVALTAATAAWACIPGGGASGGSAKRLTISPAKVQPGDEVTVSAPLAPGAAPIEVRLSGADGPRLLTLQADRVAAGKEGTATGTFVLPTGTVPGQHVLVAVQSGAKWAPTVVAVARPDGTVPEPAASVAVVAKGSDAAGLVRVLLGVTVLGLAVAGWSVRSRRATPEPVATAPR